MLRKLFSSLILIPVFQIAIAQQEIVKWTFPTGTLGDTVQNSTNTLNVASAIRIEGAGPIIMTNGQATGDYAATASNWNDGMKTKNWYISFKTTGYDQVKISSEQRAGGTNGGPKNFKLQYKIGIAGAWADIPGGTVTLGNNWTTGAITNLDLPSECQNQSDLVYIRWIMTSNADINGGNVTAAGVAKIDEIIVSGAVFTSLEPTKEYQVLTTFPNPSTTGFSIAMTKAASEVDIYNDKGQLVFKAIPDKTILKVEKSLPAGMYLIKAMIKGKVGFVKQIVW